MYAVCHALSWVPYFQENGECVKNWDEETKTNELLIKEKYWDFPGTVKLIDSEFYTSRAARKKPVQWKQLSKLETHNSQGMWAWVASWVK